MLKTKSLIFNDMKQYILFLLISFPLWGVAQDLTPEHTWHDPASASKSKWYTAQFGSTAFSYNGQMYAFNYYDDGNYNGGHTYVFKVNWNHDYASLSPLNLGSTRTNKLIFGYDNESSSFDPGPMRGRTFCFEFNNRMWYFQHVKNEAGEHETDKNESYECFAQFPLDTLQSCMTYYNKNSPPPDLTKLGAFQLDSNLYFICQNTNSSSADYHKWYLQEYYLGSDNHFHSRNRNLNLADIPTTHNMVGGIVKKLNSDGNEYIIANTYQYNSSNKIWRITPVSGSSPLVFECVSMTGVTQSDNAAITIAEGSIKGNQTSESTPDYCDRIVSYAISKNTNSNGIHSLWVLEYYINEDNNGNPTLVGLTPGHTIIIPTSTAPSKGAGDYYQMWATFELVPHVFTEAFGGSADGYQQNIWIFYPDGDKHWNGVLLESDKWRMNSEPIVSSTDLSDTANYPGIQSLWSLIGICDGGPPCPINWELWESTHLPGTDPTELEFTMISGHESEVVSTYEDQWSVGESMEISKHIMKLETSLSEEFKYSSTFKNTISKSYEVKKTLTQPFGLMESNQDSAVLLWAIPSITRYPFSLFPWWDTDLTHKIPNSDQYMFRTDGISLVPENVPISQSPFNISEPNAVTMDDWKAENRPEIWNADLYYGVNPIINVNWTGNQIGGSPTYSIEANSSDSYEQTTEWEIETELEASVPKVFRVGVSGGYKVSYSTETTVKNNYGTEITCSLDNLKAIGNGPLVNSLNLSVYWFRYNPFLDDTYPNWWYWADYDDQKPWYIAYVSNNTNSSIKLTAPNDKTYIDNSDLYFSWITEPENLAGYALIISQTAYMDNSSIVFKQTAGKSQHLSLTGFSPMEGKTYYWRVRGVTENGEPVWSDIYSFTMKSGRDVREVNLKALVYPNPAEKSDLHIAVDPVGEGRVSVQLTDMNGKVIAELSEDSHDGLPVEMTISGDHLAAGMYFAVISAGEEQVVKKVVVK